MLSELSSLPLLEGLIVLPLLGAIAVFLLPHPHQAARAALVVALLELVLALAVLAGFDAGRPGFQMVGEWPWMPTLGIFFRVGVDGISVLFLPLTAILFVMVILAAWNNVKVMPRLHFTLLLLLQSFTMGIFLALDTMMFFLFWEATLIPVYFLVSLWGVGPNRRYAAGKYVLFMLAGGVPLLFGFVLLALGAPEGLSFDLPALLARPLPPEAQLPVFLLLLVGFAVKTPLFPLHTWLPVLAMEGPATMAAIMTGLKLGAYGLIRYALPLAPDVAPDLHWLLAGLGVIGILYGALAALAQTNLRRMLAYASISHVGLVVLGLASFDIQGLQGALFQLLNFTVAGAGVFLLLGFVHHRTGSTDIAHLGGVAKVMPLAAAFFLLLGLAGMGMPATAGFPAEHLMLLSVIGNHAGAGLAALGGVIATAAYFLGCYRRAFLGPVQNQVVASLSDLQPRELAIGVGLCLLVLAGGLYPAFVLDTTRAAAEAMINHYFPKGM